MIVVDGIEYTASAGNSGSQTRAKERIQNALLGLGLLIASFVILNTINTSLTNIKNPTLSAKPIGISAQTCTCDPSKSLRTNFYCCSFSDPPTSGGGFGGGGSGGTSCYTSSSTYQCRQNPCKS